MSTFFSLLFLVALIAGIVMTVQALRRKQKMPRNAKIAFGVMAASFVLFGLTMTPEERQAAQPQASETGASPQTSESTNANGCIKVSPDMVKAILSGARGAILTNVWAAKTDDRPDWYFIAGKFTKPDVFGNEPNIAVWATDNLTAGGGLLFSVDQFALQGSQWGNGPRTRLHFSSGEEGARRASVCSMDDKE